VGAALGDAIHEKLEDRTFSGHLPPCIGVVAFGRSLGECEDELRSTLEDWILVGLRLKHPLPVVNGIDLNKEPVRESVDAL
jgi:predicted RNase H-like HicB family nuclease